MFTLFEQQNQFND